MLEFHSDGLLYATSETRDSVVRFDTQAGTRLGNFFPSGTGGLGTPIGLAFGPDNRWYVSSADNNSILRYDEDGNFVDVFLDGSSAGNVNLPVFLTIVPEPASGLLLILLVGVRRASR